eukprot:10445029-Karenia_brevis.AAC.1
MKALWLARLARPDIAKAINDLFCKITKWTRNDDKRMLILLVIHPIRGQHQGGLWRLKPKFLFPNHVVM